MATVDERWIESASRVGKSIPHDESVAVLPLPRGSSNIVQYQTYLKQQAEVVLKQCIQQLRDGTLTWNYAACALGRIAGYYDLLSEIERERRRLEEQRRD